MTCKPFLCLVVSLLTVGATWSISDTQDHQTRRNTKPIHVSHLNGSIVVGSLERPLGQVVTIEGVAVDENYTKRKADAGEILLHVLTVNGKALKREAVVPFHPYEAAEMKRPAAGTRFKYVGYETGGFSGIPEAAFVYIPRAPTSGYHFTTSVVILRDDTGSNGQ